MTTDDESLLAADDEPGFSAAQLIGRARYEPLAERPPRDLQPWHRPRKQFVRRSQWVACVRDLFNERDPADRLNYLGLPGTDLLDLRLLHESICVPQNRSLRFLGFHTGINPGSPEAVSLDVSLQQVKLRDLVHEASQVLHDDFRMIGSGDSRAFQEARRGAPYDVINLDLCSSFATEAPQSLDSLYNALNRVMAMQQRLQPWLLLITSRVSRDVLNGDAAKVLYELFKGALECPDFPMICGHYFDAEDLSSLDIESCTDHDFFLVMAMGFCVWIFRLAQRGQPLGVNVRAAFYYQVNAEVFWADMLSMAIRFTPNVVALPDPSGLAVEDESNVDECAAAVQFANRFGNAVDVDERLRGDGRLRLEMIEESARLLVEAGYDEAEYRRWVEQYQS